MKTKNLIFVAALLLIGVISCTKDPEIPTGKLFWLNDHGGGNSSSTTVSGTYNGHDYVDLGLPSGTLWATCNVGASKPQDYGNYYAWGETTTKNIYDWNTYKYANGDYKKLTKYCGLSNYGNNGFTDNLTTLQSSDDAAIANWGSGWCMPTQGEWQELIDNTSHTWTYHNGVNGQLFTASNGYTLFLPAAGYCAFSSPSVSGSYCYYWSKSLRTGYPATAWFHGSDSIQCFVSYYERFDGLPVRPVCSVRQN